jgi:phosphoglycolate phosphatase-like HAD superfamily hydrolase
MKNLIFDFDGVIGDTYDAWVETINKINFLSGNLGQMIDPKQYAAKKPNHTRDHTLTDEELAKVYERMVLGGRMVHEHGFPLFADFVTEIKSVDSKHTAVVSSGSQIYVLPALAQTDIKFTHILAYEDNHSKEEKIELVCRDWGVAVTDVYYFTDTLADVYELRNLLHKDKLIGVSWGYCTKEQLLTELSPENILDEAKDLQRVLSS